MLKRLVLTMACLTALPAVAAPPSHFAVSPHDKTLSQLITRWAREEHATVRWEVKHFDPAVDPAMSYIRHSGLPIEGSFPEAAARVISQSNEENATDPSQLIHLCWPSPNDRAKTYVVRLKSESCD